MATTTNVIERRLENGWEGGQLWVDRDVLGDLACLLGMVAMM
jgi:hypothetical protein